MMSDDTAGRGGPGPDFHAFAQVRDMFQPGDFDLRLFMTVHVPVVHAAAVAALMWPEFVEYRGGVFLEMLFDAEGVDRWFDQPGATVRSVELVTNSLHLWDAFSPAGDADHQALSGLATVLRRSWRAALHAAFPGRGAVVHLDDEPADYGPTLTFSTGP
jgi:hypothetical protein